MCYLIIYSGEELWTSDFILLVSKKSRYTVGHKIIRLHILNKIIRVIFAPLFQCINEVTTCQSSFSKKHYHGPPWTIQCHFPSNLIPFINFLSIEQSYAWSTLHLY